MIRIEIGDCRDILKTLPDNSVHCCVTSPPYYGLRDYGVDGQIGLEQTPEEYVSELVGVFREVKRVLRNDGTLWLNLGDSYAHPGNKRTGEGEARNLKTETFHGGKAHLEQRRTIGEFPGLKPKDLIGIPWRVAFALQADGWYLRQDIIWSKNNPMPESVTDRCTKSHEYIFLFSKSPKYYFDNEAIKEESVCNHPSGNGYKRSARVTYQNQDGSARGNEEQWKPTEKRNKRSVWNVNTKPYKAAHFATFPPALIWPCISAGTSEKGVCSACGAPFRRITEVTGQIVQKWGHSDYAECRQDTIKGSGDKGLRTGILNIKNTVEFEPSCSCNAVSVPATVLDPFGGSGTVGEVCNKLGRNAILIELNPAYKPLIFERTNQSLACFEVV